MKLIVTHIRTSLFHIALAALLCMVVTIIVGGTPGISTAESTANAVARIRGGLHAQMPPPKIAYAAGPVGIGMPIENDKGYLLRVHFSGVNQVSMDVSQGNRAGLAKPTQAHQRNDVTQP